MHFNCIGQQIFTSFRNGEFGDQVTCYPTCIEDDVAVSSSCTLTVIVLIHATDTQDSQALCFSQRQKKTFIVNTFVFFFTMQCFTLLSWSLLLLIAMKIFIHQKLCSCMIVQPWMWWLIGNGCSTAAQLAAHIARHTAFTIQYRRV